MINYFHTILYNDEVSDFEDVLSSTPTSSFIAETNHATVYLHQTPPSVKRIISLQHTSDEYHTANQESFNVTQNTSMNHSLIQQNNAKNSHIEGMQTGMAAITSTTGPTTMAARKQMMPGDQNEPAKPLSAYALFFRDTVSAIKQQNPTCSFQELSKIVASMWDALDQVDKGVYNKRNELARVEYLKQMKIYQQQQQQKQEQLNANNASNETSQIDVNGQQQTTNQQVTQPLASNINVEQNAAQVNNSVATSNSATTPAPDGNYNGPTEDQTQLSTEAGGAVQKCLRENCNKRAIISPDWEDEYCSNECVVIHCRNVFNDWVQSNLEAGQQDQQDANNT